MQRKLPSEKKRGRGRPERPETVVVRIGKREYELSFELTKASLGTPFRDVQIALVRMVRGAKL